MPAAVETPFRGASPARPAGIGDHDLGVASADDGREGRGPGVAPSVGDDDRRAAQLVARGEVGHPRAFEHGTPALVELAGRPPLDGRCLLVGASSSAGSAGAAGGSGASASSSSPSGNSSLRAWWTRRRNHAETLTAFSVRSLSSQRRILGSTRKRMAVSGGMRVYSSTVASRTCVWTTLTHKASLPNVLHLAWRGGR